jgi:hypothetical protein
MTLLTVWFSCLRLSEFDKDDMIEHNLLEALYHMFTTYGVCQTLISDRGSEFTNKCAAELCKLLEVTQEFTPAIAHHCLWIRTT